MKLLIAAAVLLVLLIGGMLLYGVLKEGYQPEEITPSVDGETTKPASDFTVLDTAKQQVNLSDFVGKPTVVNFWATWCGPCKSEMPAFDTLYKKYGDRVHFLMVNLTDGAQETIAGADAFIAESGYSFPVYYDTKLDAANTYGVYSIPMTLFINKEGEILGQHTGAMNEATLENYIENLLGGD